MSHGLLRVDWSALLDHEEVRLLIELALREDLGEGDITSRAIFRAPQNVQATIVARRSTVVCGLPLAAYLGRQPGYGIEVEVEPLLKEGERADAGAAMAILQGDIKAVLSIERCLLNFLMRLSGVASLSREATQAVPDTSRTKIYDTRKTTPGWRLLEKAAVRTGGAENHRFGLSDAILIKDNHVAAAGSIAAAVQRAHEEAILQNPRVPVQVEVDTLTQLQEVLPAKPDMILLDNFSLEAMREAVALTKGEIMLEASGGITIDRIAEVALTGVDRISMGQLTHSAKPADLSLELS